MLLSGWQGSACQQAQCATCQRKALRTDPGLIADPNGLPAAAAGRMPAAASSGVVQHAHTGVVLENDSLLSSVLGRSVHQTTAEEGHH